MTIRHFSAALLLLTPAAADETVLDRLWSAPAIYLNEDNPLLQEFAFQGQLQVQYAAGSDESGDFGSADRPDSCTWGDIEVRRFRFGVRARMFHSLKLHTLWDLHPDFSPRIYQRTAETYLSYMPCAAFNLSVGKVELKFTREQEISSRDYLTFERSQLVNQFYGGELTGAWVSGKEIAGGWLYELGVYGNDRRDEFSHFDGGAMLLAKLGYDYSGSCGFEFALAQVHYLHNSKPGFTSPGDPASPPYSDGIAISNSIAIGRFGLQTEAVWSNGTLGAPDVWGVTAIPSWKFTDKLQGVALLEYANSRGADGIVLPARYEACSDTAETTSGDAYVSCYAGLNYYIHGHKLKLMSGVKYAHLAGDGGGSDFDGWTWLAGLRMAF
jgi:phosphate-selective porin OprO and OprP